MAIGLTLMVVSSAVFAVTETTSRLADRSEELHRLNELQRLLEGHRAAAGFGIHLAALGVRFEDWDLGADLTEALDEMSSSGEGIDALLAASQPIEEVVAFRASTDRLAALLSAGKTQAAQTLAEQELQPLFLDASRRVSSLRSERLDAITEIDRTGARVGDLARMIVVLGVPVALVLVYREIVERQLRQRQLELQLEAEHALGSARDEFVANASHELRTPLTGILGLSEVLISDDRIPEDAREMLGMVTSEAADLARIVEDLLTTARLAAGQLRYEPRRVPTLEEVTVVIRPFQQAGREIQVDVEDAAVYVDRLRQRQILRNLVSNAVKYGGDTITLGGHRHGAYFRWTVVDDGPGVSPELERKLFQRYIHTLTFQQAVAGGVGLGLSIAKTLAEGMGGGIGYSRADGKTQFFVDLPLADGSAGDRPSIHAAGGVR